MQYINVSQKSCIVCHNSANNGTNMSNDLFDIRTASVEARTPDLPLYTFRNKRTGETRRLTDAGLGNITGLWNDLGTFKTPTLRGLAARAPYFHNGIAATLEDVVRHYENHFGFIFTDEERADLVAFLTRLKPLGRQTQFGSSKAVCPKLNEGKQCERQVREEEHPCIFSVSSGRPGINLLSPFLISIGIRQKR